MRICSSALILFMLSGLSQTVLGDEQKQEDYFFNIYQKYNAQPTAPEVWEQALGKTPSREYTLVKGDTLWDVSKTLFGDGFFWSKVWSLNPAITNPHQVAVGQTIHFFPGAGLSAPGLSVDNYSNIPSLSKQTAYGRTKWWLSQDLAPATSNFGGLPIPPAAKRYSDVLDPLPASLPPWRYRVQLKDKVEKLEIIEANREAVKNQLVLPFFISNEDPKVMGTVYEMDRNALTAGEGDILYINADAEFEIGKIYSVIRELGEVTDPEGFSSDPMAYEVQGEIRIIEEVDETYKAKVVRNVYPISLDALVIPGPMPKMDLTTTGSPASIQAQVIGGENELGRTHFGQQSIIYLNRGSVDGIKLNQRAPVMENHQMRNPVTEIYGTTKRVGEIKIVRVEENYSTAVVLWNNDPVMTGDFIGRITEGSGSRSARGDDDYDDDEFGDSSASTGAKRSASDGDEDDEDDKSSSDSEDEDF